MVRKKKILVLFRAKDSKKTRKKNSAIWRWVEDCWADYDFEFWGRDYSIDGSYSFWDNNTLSEKEKLLRLKKKIDIFKPDYIYMTLRKGYDGWLPDLTNITVPKIYVEVDSQYYDVNDPWYGQFDIIKCREPSFNGWDKIPLFRWSVPEIAFPITEELRKGVYFIGQIRNSIYPMRKRLKREFCTHIRFLKQQYKSQYWSTMHRASCLVCPTESVFGNFTPAKLFEYLASGAAVLTNCDFKKAGIPEMKEFAIIYRDFIRSKSKRNMYAKLDIDFVPYYNKAIPAMREHTHRIRYKEIFG